MVGQQFTWRSSNLGSLLGERSKTPPEAQEQAEHQDDDCGHEGDAAQDQPDHCRKAQCCWSRCTEWRCRGGRWQRECVSHVTPAVLQQDKSR